MAPTVSASSRAGRHTEITWAPFASTRRAGSNSPARKVRRMVGGTALMVTRDRRPRQGRGRMAGPSGRPGPGSARYALRRPCWPVPAGRPPHHLGLHRGATPMSVTIRVPPVFRTMTSGSAQVDVEGATIGEVLSRPREPAPRLLRQAVRRQRGPRPLRQRVRRRRRRAVHGRPRHRRCPTAPPCRSCRPSPAAERVRPEGGGAGAPSAGEPALVDQSSSRRTSSGSHGSAPPTTTGVRNRWYSSTSPARMAWAATSGPPIDRSRADVALSSRIARDELPLDARPVGRGHVEGPRVHDLVGGLPELGEVADDGEGSARGAGSSQ